MGEHVYLNDESRVYHARRDTILLGYCRLEVTDELPREIDPETAQYLLDATEIQIQADLQKTYGIGPAQSRGIIATTIATFREEVDKRAIY